MTIHNVSEWPFVFFMDRLTDLVFLIDIVLNFRTGWVMVRRRRICLGDTELDDACRICTRVRTRAPPLHSLVASCGSSRPDPRRAGR